MPFPAALGVLAEHAVIVAHRDQARIAGIVASGVSGQPGQQRFRRLRHQRVCEKSRLLVTSIDGG